jgi:hypothetical protein
LLEAGGDLDKAVTLFTERKEDTYIFQRGLLMHEKNRTNA